MLLQSRAVRCFQVSSGLGQYYEYSSSPRRSVHARRRGQRGPGTPASQHLHQTPSFSTTEDEVIDVKMNDVSPQYKGMMRTTRKNDEETEEDARTADTTTTTTTSIWTVLAERASHLLYLSDMRRDAIGKKAGTPASSATNWINDAAAFALQKTLDKIQLQTPIQSSSNVRHSNHAATTAAQRDEARSWWRWLQSIPAPAIVDLTSEFGREINATLTDRALDHIDQGRDEFLSRIACRLILLPSGTSLDGVLTEPSASVVYGKLLYGGVTRYRILGRPHTGGASSVRRAGVRTEVKPTARDNVPVWMMYGGADRMYEAVDMGPAAILEIVLLPRTKQHLDRSDAANIMQIQGMPWPPKEMFEFQPTADDADYQLDGTEGQDDNYWGPASSLSGKSKNDAFRSEFQTAVGGLQPQIDAIVRRVLDGRVLRPVNGLDDQDSMVVTTAAEAKELELLGLSPVRGLLLYGPPGCVF
jgi:hypothetical protein